MVEGSTLSNDVTTLQASKQEESILQPSLMRTTAMSHALERMANWTGVVCLVSESVEKDGGDEDDNPPPSFIAPQCTIPTMSMSQRAFKRMCTILKEFKAVAIKRGVDAGTGSLLWDRVVEVTLGLAPLLISEWRMHEGTQALTAT